MKSVTIYTDGACKGNPGPGGWGAVIMFGPHTKEIHGFEAETTNNRMELTAVIMALEALKEPCKVDLYADSQYVLKGINDWITGWKQRGWKTANKKPVKNEDLWRRLDGARQVHKIAWHWVKGHAGNVYNERADDLANLAFTEVKSTANN